MKLVSIVLPLGIFAVCVTGQAQQGISKPAETPAVQAPTVTAPTTPAAAPAQAPAAPTAAPAAPNFGVAATPPSAIQSAAPSSGQSAASADVAPDYILGPEDAISVNVWKEATLSGNLAIRPDGKITLPLLGDLQASGLTPMALAASIGEQLKKFINDPVVTVTVTGVNSKRIFFIGEVGHPGPVAMTRQFSMLQAVAAAGGLGAFANGKKIYILRTVNGKEQKIFYNYNKALKTGDEQGIKLIPGDTIVVP
jgi:polysaccharide export outer membrane protein